MQRVIISGSTSAIGRALVVECTQHGAQVLALKREMFAHTVDLLVSPLICYKDCSMEEFSELTAERVGKYDVFFHLAWSTASEMGRNDVYEQERNIFDTLAAVQAAKRLGCKRFVGIGSQAEYRHSCTPLKPDSPIEPAEAYGASKYAAYQLSSILCEQLGIEHIWVRIFSLYGPYDYKNTLVNYVIRQFLNREIPVLTKCEQVWDYLYYDDAARALFELGKVEKLTGKVYNLGSGYSRPLSQFVYKIRDVIDPKLTIEYGGKPYMENQLMYLCADIGALTADTGFKPHVDFEEGIEKTINWYKYTYVEKMVGGGG